MKLSNEIEKKLIKYSWKYGLWCEYHNEDLVRFTREHNFFGMNFTAHYHVTFMLLENLSTKQSWIDVFNRVDFEINQSLDKLIERHYSYGNNEGK